MKPLAYLKNIASVGPEPPIIFSKCSVMILNRKGAGRREERRGETGGHRGDKRGTAGREERRGEVGKKIIGSYWNIYHGDHFKYI